VGAQAPEFTLVADDERKVSLSDFRGRQVVLYFYPKAMTSGCTAQACAFRDASPELDARGAVVVGISPDPPKALAKFRQRDGLNFVLLSDPDHAVATSYGAWGPKSMYGRSYEGVIRSQFVIDEDGRIKAASPKVSPAESLPKALEVL
jgi:peroxiredoxin Q/BCP